MVCLYFFADKTQKGPGPDCVQQCGFGCVPSQRPAGLSSWVSSTFDILYSTYIWFIYQAVRRKRKHSEHFFAWFSISFLALKTPNAVKVAALSLAPHNLLWKSLILSLNSAVTHGRVFPSRDSWRGKMGVEKMWHNVSQILAHFNVQSKEDLHLLTIADYPAYT